MLATLAAPLRGPSCTHPGVQVMLSRQWRLGLPQLLWQHQNNEPGVCIFFTESKATCLKKNLPLPFGWRCRPPRSPSLCSSQHLHWAGCLKGQNVPAKKRLCDCAGVVPAPPSKQGDKAPYFFNSPLHCSHLLANWGNCALHSPAVLGGFDTIQYRGNE